MRITKGFRKVFVSLAVFVVVEVLGTVALFTGKITGDQWVALTEWVATAVVGAFAVGSGAEHFAARGQAKES